MLILKRKFPNDNLRAILLCAVFGLPGIGAAQAAPAHAATPPHQPQPARAPDTVAAEFYGWYLDALFADQDPLSDRYERFNAYVARDLTKSLVERLGARPLPQTDYFLQTPAWQPGWRNGVRAAMLRRERGAAEVLVTLGGADAPARALLISMVLENGAWKIRRVRPADTLPGSSAEQLVI